MKVLFLFLLFIVSSYAISKGEIIDKCLINTNNAYAHINRELNICDKERRAANERFILCFLVIMLFIVLFLALLKGKNEGTDKDKCNICYDEVKDVVFDPCGHLCICNNCYNNFIESDTCPMCRSTINKGIKVYDS